MVQFTDAQNLRSSLRLDVSSHIRGRVLDLSLNYWESKIIDGRIPARRDIEPLDIPELLPQIILLDVTRKPWHFRFRLIGTNVVYHLSEDWTGSWFSEIGHMAAPSRIFTACVNVASSGNPLRNQTPYIGPHSNFVSSEDLILPLSDDGETVDKLLVFVEYFSKG
jgi:hypothetical protein